MTNTSITCPCLMKIDLESATDIDAFFKDNFPLPSLLTNLSSLSKQELRCACCLMATALTRTPQKDNFWKRLKSLQ